jgi:phosphoribosyl-AMP cyclohydrolase
LNKNFGTRFSNFVCLEYELRNVFSKIFAEFEPEKFRKTHLWKFFSRVKSKYWEGGEKSPGGRREKSARKLKTRILRWD